MTEATPLASEQKPLNLDGYYIGFEATGRFEIDLILSAVARAGKAYHNTADWNDDTPPYDERFRGETPVDWIQHAANDAADAIAALSASPAPSDHDVDGATAVIRARAARLGVGFITIAAGHVPDAGKLIAPSGQGVSGEGWDHRYRPLAFGEIIEAGDECRRDDGTWVTGVCVGEPAPDPAYTSHRLYRRLKAAPAPSCAPGEVVALAERIRAAVTYQYMPMAVRRLLSEAAAALSPQGLDAKEGGE